jgi:two-component system response regulator NreC
MGVFARIEPPMMNGNKTKILLADDHRMVRAGLRSLLEAEAGLDVVAEADDGRTAVKLAAEVAPDVVIMDISMPDLNGVEATRQIRSAPEGESPKVIALSGHTDKRFTLEMLKAGASGYVLKDSAFEELAKAVRAVVADQIYLSPGVADVVVRDAVGGPGHEPAFARLSPREREVLQLTAEGKAMKEIAAHLHVSIKTVETHRRNLMEKLNLHSVAELTKFAVREGMTSLEA